MESSEDCFFVSFLCKDLQLLRGNLSFVLFALTEHFFQYDKSFVLGRVLLGLLFLVFGRFVRFFCEKQRTHTVFFNFFNVEKFLIYELEFFGFNGFYIESVMRRCFSRILAMYLSNFLSFLDVLFHIFEHLLVEI